MSTAQVKRILVYLQARSKYHLEKKMTICPTSIIEEKDSQLLISPVVKANGLSKLAAEKERNMGIDTLGSICPSLYCGLGRPFGEPIASSFLCY